MPVSVLRPALGAGRTRWAHWLVASLLPLLLVVLTPPALGAPEPSIDTDLLQVHLDEITPVVRNFGKPGKVRMVGTVTNTTADTWTRVNLHAFSSQAPILDAPSLAASAATDPADYVGARVTEPGTFDTIDSLAPGQSARFDLSVPIDLLGIDDGSGAYWIGVHALGDSSVPRDDFADGKARTFIPVLSRKQVRSSESVPVSIVLPVRGPVWNSPGGRLSRTGRWLRDLSEGGRYDTLLDVAETAGTTPHSLLVDPAVLLSISRLTIGNPPRSLHPDPSIPDQQPTETPQPSESADGAGGGPVATLPPTPDDDLDEEQLELASAARVWMARFLEVARERDVLSLPFGDLDINAASRIDSTRYTDATERSLQVMTALGLPYQPALAPPEGLLRPEVLAIADPAATILVDDTAFAVAPESSVVTVSERRLVLTSSGTAAGGPAPTHATDPLAVRQRLLSEAALRLGGSDTPIVWTLPEGWSTTEAQVVLDAFDEPWLSASTLSDVAATTPIAVTADNLVYTEDDAAAELDPANFASADDLTAIGSLFEEVLTLQTTVEQQALDEALLTLSTQVRSQTRRAALSAEGATERMSDQLSSIKVLAPPAVTLSSDSGPIGTTLLNGLDQPVTVALTTESDGDITVGGTETRQLGPRSRTLARLEVTAKRAGVHRVRLLVTSEDGTPLGASADLPIRAAQVSGLIWLAMAGGATLLFGAITVRLLRRIRRRRTREAAA